ncbi:hypothetical protein C1X21_26065 [Pseudomonas sp. FW305-3-2-15-A-LB2]|jgi:hypothetical protein|nr:hypothetical protein C1X17_23990 [Pseudomonas sp. FW305-3-2-15-C-TSA2]PMV22441.1 hypothetical protein C1X22_24260 [Pseudomonas sp. DP16D-L5]PMV35179.1 hypothetical protein C1X21_26065 [Pseudomonas sp. FW305-3-2-15-A-LB2]PMV40539.1 hypothetical protein C1X16_26125 [Pseudomonas sp. FW305-3-2-15-C-R2A1]PMV45722.1 hypothetical protein C1X18_24180 [Pseudomonas sp. FW305-3-2-15-C-LB1]PMV51194.1 hypothetical protein C1X19_24615 [Pseudomonas sp. GW460-4]PMV59067.1 hypothetical protein C1X20_25235 
MNSTSFESLQSQYNVPTLATLAQEAERPTTSPLHGVNLTSSPKCSFKAPTAEDFDKGSRMFIETPAHTPVLSTVANFLKRWSSRG